MIKYACAVGFSVSLRLPRSVFYFIVSHRITSPSLLPFLVGWFASLIVMVFCCLEENCLIFIVLVIGNRPEPVLEIIEVAGILYFRLYLPGRMDVADFAQT